MSESAIVRPVMAWLCFGVLALVLSAIALYSPWGWTLMGVQMLSAGLALMLLVCGVLVWRKGDRRGLSSLCVAGVIMAAPAWVSHREWVREHDAFMELVREIRAGQERTQGPKPSQLGCPGIEREPAVAAIAARIRGLEFDRGKYVVWHAMSSRRSHYYNCVTRQLT